MNIIEKLKVLGSKETFEKIKNIVEQVEFDNPNLKGNDKKELAVKTLNKLIDIPFLTEGMEHIILGIMVDKAVYYLNKLVWKRV